MGVRGLNRGIYFGALFASSLCLSYNKDCPTALSEHELNQHRIATSLSERQGFTVVLDHLGSLQFGRFEHSELQGSGRTSKSRQFERNSISLGKGTLRSLSVLDCPPTPECLHGITLAISEPKNAADTNNIQVAVDNRYSEALALPDGMLATAGALLRTGPETARIYVVSSEDIPQLYRSDFDTSGGHAYEWGPFKWTASLHGIGSVDYIVPLSRRSILLAKETGEIYQMSLSRSSLDQPIQREFQELARVPWIVDLSAHQMGGKPQVWILNGKREPQRWDEAESRFITYPLTLPEGITPLRIASSSTPISVAWTSTGTADLEQALLRLVAIGPDAFLERVVVLASDGKVYGRIRDSRSSGGRFFDSHAFLPVWNWVTDQEDALPRELSELDQNKETARAVTGLSQPEIDEGVEKVTLLLESEGVAPHRRTALLASFLRRGQNKAWLVARATGPKRENAIVENLGDLLDQIGLDKLPGRLIMFDLMKDQESRRILTEGLFAGIDNHSYARIIEVKNFMFKSSAPALENPNRAFISQLGYRLGMTEEETLEGLSGLLSERPQFNEMPVYQLMLLFVRKHDPLWNTK